MGNETLEMFARKSRNARRAAGLFTLAGVVPLGRIALDDSLFSDSLSHVGETELFFATTVLLMIATILNSRARDYGAD